MNCGQQSRQQFNQEQSKMEQILKNVGVCLDVEGGMATAYGEWDEERRAGFLSSILGGGKKKGPEKMIECCMCGDTIKDRKSHNAQPVYEGRCCWECNNLVYLQRAHQQEKAGDDFYREVRLVIEAFPSQHKWAWTTLKNHIKQFKQFKPGKVLDFCPIAVIRNKSVQERKAEDREQKDWVERMERHKRMMEENTRLEKIEEERKVRDEEETKKRQADFEMRLKALEVKEAQRKEEEKREKEEKARKAEEKRAQKEAEKAEKQKKFQKGKQ